jgi:hypothetical protein
MLIDLVHEYGASHAASEVTPLTQEKAGELEWLFNTTGLRNPGKLLVQYGTSRSTLNLHYSLNNIEDVPNLGTRARGIIVNWILFYGILELGIRSNILALQLPTTFSAAALQDLDIVDETYWYKLELPLLAELHRRFVGRGVREVEPGERARDLFCRFLLLNSSIRVDPYLQSLHEITRQEPDQFLGNLREIFASPQYFCERISLSSTEIVRGDHLVLSLCRGLFFIRELFDLLEEARESHPFIAESMRWYASHWTDLLSFDTGEKAVALILDSYESWARNANDADAIREIEHLRLTMSQFLPAYA